MKLAVVISVACLMAAHGAPVAEPEAEAKADPFLGLGSIAIPALTGSALIDGLLIGKVAFLKAAILANLILNQGGKKEQQSYDDSYGPPADNYGPPEGEYGPPADYAPPSDGYGPPAVSYGPPADEYGAPEETYGAPSYQEPAAPSYSAPSYSPPSYSPAAPSYSAPSYSAPSYSAPAQDSYGSPSADPVQDTYGSPYQPALASYSA